MNRQPDPTPDVIDCTGVSIANTDIPVPEWVPTEVTPGSTPLPVYPQPSDLPPPPVLDAIERQIVGRMHADGLLPDRRGYASNAHTFGAQVRAAAVIALAAVATFGLVTGGAA